MMPSNYTLQTHYLRYSGACRLCAMPLRLVERYTPFRTAYFTDLQDLAITRCTRCNWVLDATVKPKATRGFVLLP